jgi:hypothetical protein
VGYQLEIDATHIDTSIRRAYAVDKANGETGYFVVTQYGTRTDKFDVLHSAVWKHSSSGWKIVCAFFMLRCPPGSIPVELSPNKSPGQPGQE